MIALETSSSTGALVGVSGISTLWRKEGPIASESVVKITNNLEFRSISLHGLSK